MRDKAWFFVALRRALSSSGISRTEAEVARIEAYPGSVGLFDNDSESWQPFAKVTSRFGRHDLQAFYQRDRLLLTGDREYNYEPIMTQSTGGSLYSGKITSVWGSIDHLLQWLLQRQGRQRRLDLRHARPDRAADHHPQQRDPGGATLQGTGRILEGGNLQSYNLQPASQIVVRGDLTYYKDGWAGSHEVQTGFFIAPRNTYNQDTRYVNDGFVLEEHRLIDVNNIAGGTVPFRRRYQSPVDLRTRQAEDRDIAIYVQDSWRPHPRLSLNLGVRADFVKRDDILFDITRQNSTEIGPRFGFSYQVTGDARTDPARQRRAGPRAGDGP